MVIIGFGSLSAQEKRPRNLSHYDFKQLHWGFTVGLNSMDYAIKRNLADPNASDPKLYADVIGFQPSGFQVNIVSDLRLSDFWTLRFLPGINLGSRKIEFYDPYPDNSDGGNIFPDTKQWEEVIPDEVQRPDDFMTMMSSYLDFPLIIKYRSERVNNYRPYVIGGLSYRYDMSARDDYPGDNGDQDRYNTFLVKKGNLYLEFGVGLDNYLQYFKFAPELKVAIGLRNMMVSDNALSNKEYYANSISDLRSFLVMLNFHFE